MRNRLKYVTPMGLNRPRIGREKREFFEDQEHPQIYLSIPTGQLVCESSGRFGVGSWPAEPFCRVAGPFDDRQGTSYKTQSFPCDDESASGPCEGEP